MRFLVDECTGPTVANWLHEQGHEVFSIYEKAPVMDDDEIIKKAFTENWILITNDKDFGEKVYKEKHSHKGVLFLRLDDERNINKIHVIKKLLERYAHKLPDHFVVVTEKQVGFAQK